MRVCADDVKTRLPEKMRTTLNGSGQWCTHRAVPRNMNVVIDVRVVECHASMDVVIGVRVVLCHQVIDFPLF